MPCIYPGPHGVMSEEHYLPAALGRFDRYEPLLDRVCRECNRRIGDAVEVQFLRAGPIAFFRWITGVPGRDGSPPSPFYRGAGGAPPLYMVARAPDLDEDWLWEADPGTENVYPLRQVVFEHPIAGRHAIAIFDWMRDRPDLLLDQLRERDLQEATPVRAFAAAEEIPWVVDLLRGIGHEFQADWVVTEFEPQRIQLVVNISVTDAYLRAIAKIAFHYALKVFPDLTGTEPEFEAIKEFIWAGGDANRLVQQPAGYQLVENFRRGQRPTQWMHILAVERTYDAITAYAQFFVGPRCLPPPYVVRIGRDPSRIIRRREQRAHQFVILDPAATSGFVGVVEDAQPAQLIRPA